MRLPRHAENERNQSAAVEASIRKLHLETVRAQLVNDAATLGRVWADDHTFTNPPGIVQTKADRLAEIRSGDRRRDSFDVVDVQVRVYGDTAIVTSRGTLKGHLRGEEFTLQASLTRRIRIVRNAKSRRHLLDGTSAQSRSHN